MKPITEKQLEKTMLLIKKGLSNEDIAEVTELSERSVKRIRSGQHILQIRAKEADEKANKPKPAQKANEGNGSESGKEKKTAGEKTAGERLMHNSDVIKKLLLEVCDFLEENQKIITEVQKNENL